MNIKLEDKKMYGATINQCLENVLDFHIADFQKLDYKKIIETITEKHGVTSYEVLNYIKELESDGSIRFYQINNVNERNIGIVSETYRLKIEEKFEVSSSDYLNDFMNEALILDLVS